MTTQEVCSSVVLDSIPVKTIKVHRNVMGFSSTQQLFLKEYNIFIGRIIQMVFWLMDIILLVIRY